MWSERIRFVDRFATGLLIALLLVWQILCADPSEVSAGDCYNCSICEVTTAKATSRANKIGVAKHENETFDGLVLFLVTELIQMSSF